MKKINSKDLQSSNFAPDSPPGWKLPTTPATLQPVTCSGQSFPKLWNVYKIETALLNITHLIITGQGWDRIRVWVGQRDQICDWPGGTILQNIKL